MIKLLRITKLKYKIDTTTNFSMHDLETSVILMLYIVQKIIIVLDGQKYVGKV